MAEARAIRSKAGKGGDTLFQRIGDFLEAQRLAPDPTNYAFAYQVLVYPDAPLGEAVAKLVDGGVRLTQRDIETIGADIGGASIPAFGAAPAPQAPPTAAATAAASEKLVSLAQLQVQSLQSIVTGIRAETQGFGRDLEASADALKRAAGPGDLVGEVVRLTGAMVERVRSAESRLEEATHEACELRQKLEEAQDNARRDPLTGLPNRRAFDEAFDEADTARALTVGLVDVDHFKSINDRFGHGVGDRVLKAIAATLEQECGGHLVARIGGEEFAILFAGTATEAATATLDRARECVAGRRLRLRESDEPLGAVSFSAGVTARRGGEPLNETLKRADQLLYRAKGAGRNCIHAA